VLRHLEAIRGYRAPPLPAFDAYRLRGHGGAPDGVHGRAVGTSHPDPVARGGRARSCPISVAFPVVTIGSFALACLLLFAFLRRRGHRPWAASLGVVAFALLAAGRELVAAPFLVEPLACALLVALLLALEMGRASSSSPSSPSSACSRRGAGLVLPVVYFASRRAACARRA
jgi:hypothetical protein